MKIKNKIFWVIFIAPIFILTSIIIRKHSQGVKIDNDDIRPFAMTNLQKSINIWGTNAVVLIDNELINKLFSEGLLVEPKLALTDEQKVKLTEKLTQFLKTYSQTNFSNYQAFALSDNSEINPAGRDFMQKKAALAGEQLPKDSVGYARIAWDLLNRTNRITRLSPSSFQVKILQAQSSDVAQFFDLAKDPENPHMAIKSFFSPLIFHPTLDEILQVENKAQCAHIKFYAEINNSSAVVPVHLIFYWNNRQSVWMPWGMYGIFFLNYNTVF